HGRTGPQLSFNYLGQLDHTLSEESPFAPAPEASGPSQSPAAERPHLLEINGSVAEGRLQIGWTYGGDPHRPATVERLAAELLESLRSLIAHCLEPEARGYTPSDFPLGGVTQHVLDRITGSVPDLEDLYPLSPLQEGMLFEGLYAPESEAYF